MKHCSLLILISSLLVAGFAHTPTFASSVEPAAQVLKAEPAASNSEEHTLKPSAVSPKSVSKQSDDKEYSDYVEEPIEKKEKVEISDPIEPFNRAMYHFNDKLYFWVLKPVAQAYSEVVPEVARASVQNFFTNLASPIRFVSSLLQANFSGAATEVGRTVINTVWGIGGLLDPSSSNNLDIAKQNVDLGQTLGVYGLGQGFYIVWPILGPSSARDSVGLAGEYFLSPVSYVTPWYASTGVRAYEVVNDTSLKIGDYESLKEAAIDPYVALRDAYAQYRQKKVEGGGVKSEQSSPDEKLFAPPRPISIAAEGLRTGVGYWYRGDILKNDAQYTIRQNQIYSQVGYGAKNHWEIYARIGVSDLKILDAFNTTNASTMTSKNDFEGDWKLFGTLGAKGFYPLNETFAIGAFMQGSYSFNGFKDSVSGINNGVPFSVELKVKNLWDVNSGIGVQATVPYGIKMHIGPYIYYCAAKVYPSANISGLNFTESDMIIKNKTYIGGFAEAVVPLFKGFNLNVEGKYSERFSAGVAVTYDY
ncbi:MAG: VacJ family lipoprotein [Syntrophales bacterium LBB04]|nr:VacJ family lipoprotein [Syntrophales bacterium LBB04]